MTEKRHPRGWLRPVNRLEDDTSHLDYSRHQLRGAVEEWLARSGLSGASVFASACAAWSGVVGSEVAAHARPKVLRGTELVVAVDSAAWGTELGFLAEGILAGLEQEVGRPVARSLKVQVDPRFPLEWES